VSNYSLPSGTFLHTLHITGQIFVLPQDPSNSSYLCKVQLPSVPVLLSISGLFDIEWRISVICRDGRMYSVRNGEVRGSAVLSGQVSSLMCVSVCVCVCSVCMCVVCVVCVFVCSVCVVFSGAALSSSPQHTEYE